MIKRMKNSGKILAAVLSAMCLLMTACTGGQGSGPVNSGSGPSQNQESGNEGSSQSQSGSTETDNGSGSQDAGNSETGSGEDNNTADGGSEVIDEGMGDDVFTHVSDVDSFLEAIEPGARIKIEPGYYNLSEYLVGAPAFAGYDTWNENHKYVKIRSQYDGPELVIQDAEGLIIEGGSDNAADTEIVIDPRYAAVIWFIGSDDLEISNITMGHTEIGECCGNVLNFDYCRNVHLNNVDLYGCGVYAIGCDKESGDLFVADSTLRDCSGGSFYLFNVKGDFVFDRCTFTGSSWGGYYDSTEHSQLTFNNCSFGQNESNTWYFSEEVTLNDCDLMEPTYYPEYGGSDEW